MTDLLKQVIDSADHPGRMIASQILCLDPRAFWAWGIGVKTFIQDGLRFKTSGMVKWKGIVEIKINYGTDLYELEFYRLRAGKKFIDKVLKDIFVEDLVAVLDEQIG